MYDDKKRHRTAFSEATIPPCRHWRYACCMTLIRRETLGTMSSSCCCRQRCRGFFLGSYGTAVALSWIEPKVSTGRHQSLTHSTLRTPPRGFVVYGLSLWSGELSPDKDFYRSLCPFEVILKLYKLEPLLHRLTSGRFLFLYLVCRCSWLSQAPVPMAHFLIVAFAVSDYTVFDTHLICGWENRRSCNV